MKHTICIKTGRLTIEPAKNGGVSITVKQGIWPEGVITLSSEEAALIAGALENAAIESEAA